MAANGANRTLAGRTLFITGASRGIGLAIALRAARDGANVAIARSYDCPHQISPFDESEKLWAASKRCP